MEPRTSQRQTRAQARATCRTCKGCRQRKVKCDGQRPVCGTCRLKHRDCEYPQDARKTVMRAKREDITSLQLQIEELKCRTRGHINADSTGVDGLHTHERSGYDNFTSGVSHSQGPIPVRSHVSNPSPPICNILCNPRRSDELRTAGVAQQDNEESTDVILEPPESEEIQIYGATNLRNSHQEPVSAACPLEDNDDEITRDQLIAFSAMMLQKEAMMYTTPSIIANVDFDGVPMDMAMHLLELHWNRLHLSYLLTYRPAIMDSLFNNGPYMNKLLLNAIYLQSSLYSDRMALRSDPNDPRTMGMAFYDRFKALLPHYVDQPSMPSVVALLTCGACLIQYGKQSASWLFCGMAYRMIFDLGYHLDDANSSPKREDKRLLAMDKEFRRRIYWGAYATDKSQSLFLGRLPGLRKYDTNVPIQFLDSYEELEEWKPYVDPQIQPYGSPVPVYRGRPSYAVSTFQCLVQLFIIAETIITAFYATGSSKLPESVLLRSRRTVKTQLEQWRMRLPAHLLFDPSIDETPPPHQMTLHTTFWTLVILTEQPFLARSHFDVTMDAKLQSEARRACIEAAFQVRILIQAYKKAFTLRRAQYGISYAMYSAVLVLLQHADQDCDEYIEAIQFFWLALLEFQSGCGRGLKGPLKLLKSLMRRVEKVAQRIDIDHPETAVGWFTSNDSQLAIDAVAGIEALGETENQTESWLNAGTDDLFFADDTIFGFFTQEG